MPLKDVLLDELRDMYSAENQLVKALPMLAKGAKDAKLKELFTQHLEETKGQVEYLCIARRNNTRIFNHEYHCPLWSMRSMYHGPGHHKGLTRRKFDSAVLKIDQ